MSNPKEVWRGIKGYEGLYEVSNLGNIRSLDAKIQHSITKTFKRKGRILKPDYMKDGYTRHCLSKDGKRCAFMTHRLVAEAFIDNPENFSFINHKDEVRGNNCVDNLEWCDEDYNLSYSLARYYIVTSPDGEEIEVYNLSAFCRENELQVSPMSQMATGWVASGRQPREHYKGWKCRYLDGTPIRGVNKNIC